MTLSDLNLFKYATNELSQDAIICWIIAWANSDDQSMKKLAIDVLGLFLDIHHEDPVILRNLESVKIQRQVDHVDILFTLYFENGQNMKIILEDKTNSSMHDDQLNRYSSAINDESGRVPLGIYFKSGLIDDFEQESVNKSLYQIVTKNAFIKILEQHKTNIKSDIFQNYFDYLRDMMEMENSFEDIIASDNLQGNLQIFDSSIGQTVLMRKIFEPDKYKYGKLLSGTSFGRPWKQFYIQEAFNYRELPDAIFYRLDCRKDGYYIALRQHLWFDEQKRQNFLNGNNESTIFMEKKERLDKLIFCFEQAISHASCIMIKPGRRSNKGKKESEIGVFFIGNITSFTQLINDISLFNEEFIKLIQIEFKYQLKPR